MHKRILFIPIDDRPVTLKLPRRMAELAGVDLVMPPRNILGCYMEPGKCNGILQWLKQVPGPFDGAVICGDMPLYGGLVASRLPRPEVETIVERLETLSDIINRRREEIGPVYLFLSLLRTAPTYTDETLIPVAESIIRYSTERYHLDKGHGTSEKNLKLIEKDIPGDILKQYMETRFRNFLVHMKVLELMEEGLADFLLIGIDDSRTAGLNVLEREDIQESIQKRRLTDEVIIVPGTDESPCLLLCRMLSRIEKANPSYYPIFSREEAPRLIPRYEDRSLGEILHLQGRAAGLTCAQTPDEADFILYLHAPQNTQKEASTQQFKLVQSRDIARGVETVRDFIKKGIPIALADVYYANGADCAFMETLSASVNLLDLRAFAGWNTAGNTIGTVLAHGGILEIADPKICDDETAHKMASTHGMLIMERLADDWLYQSKVRREITARAILQRVSMFHLDNNGEKFRRLIEESLKSHLVNLFESCLPCSFNFRTGDRVREYLISGPGKVRVSLPWERLFEVDINMRVKVEAT